MLNKIKSRLKYETIKPLFYMQELRDAYSSGSICGGCLKGKTVLITGGTGGIGVALAIRFLNEGCHVIITARDQKKLDTTINYLKVKKGDCAIEGVILNLEEDSLECCVAKLRQRKHFVDILVNNAGVLTEVDKKRKFRTVTQEEFDAVWKVNYAGTVYLSERVIEEMNRRSMDGSIVNIASICALTKNYQYTPYGLSKSAILEFTKQLKNEHPMLNIHAIAPGSVATAMGNLKLGDNVSLKCNVLNHPALPEEIAAMVAFVASDMGRAISNSAIIASACETL